MRRNNKTIKKTVGAAIALAAFAMVGTLTPAVVYAEETEVAVEETAVAEESAEATEEVQCDPAPVEEEAPVEAPAEEVPVEAPVEEVPAEAPVEAEVPVEEVAVEAPVEAEVPVEEALMEESAVEAFAMASAGVNMTAQAQDNDYHFANETDEAIEAAATTLLATRNRAGDEAAQRMADQLVASYGDEIVNSMISYLDAAKRDYYNGTYTYSDKTYDDMEYVERLLMKAQVNNRKNSNTTPGTQSNPGNGGEQEPSNPGNGGEQEPSNPGNGGEQEPSNPGNGGEQEPSNPGNGGEQEPANPGNGGEQEPSNPGNGGEQEPANPGNGGEQEPSNPGNGGEQEPSNPGNGGEQEPAAPGNGGKKNPANPGNGKGGTSNPGNGSEDKDPLDELLDTLDKATEAYAKAERVYNNSKQLLDPTEKELIPEVSDELTDVTKELNKIVSGKQNSLYAKSAKTMVNKISSMLDNLDKVKNGVRVSYGNQDYDIVKNWGTDTDIYHGNLADQTDQMKTLVNFYRSQGFTIEEGNTPNVTILVSTVQCDGTVQIMIFDNRQEENLSYRTVYTVKPVVTMNADN